MSEQEIEQFCAVDAESADILMRGAQRFGLSERSINKIKKVARTIADLEGSEKIAKAHILEALSYRRL